MRCKLLMLSCLVLINSRLSAATVENQLSSSPTTNGKIQNGSQTKEKELEPGYIDSLRRPGAYFGFGLSKINQLGDTNHFDYLYGSKPNLASLEAGYYVFSYLVDIGFFAKISYGKADGHPLKSSQNVTFPTPGDLPPDLALDQNQSLELTMIPLQIRSELAFSPFKSRRVVLRGWVGLERIFLEEVLKPKLSGNVNDAGSESYLHKGWNTGAVTGASISISLNGIEPRSDYALKALGIDKTYISPFLEVSKTQTKKMGNFDRKTYGIAFNFESLR